jgi:hypothetical protein
MNQFRFVSDGSAGAEPRNRHRPRLPAGCWLHREDFTRRFIITGISLSVGIAVAGIG